jgi:endonuclease-3
MRSSRRKDSSKQRAAKSDEGKKPPDRQSVPSAARGSARAAARSAPARVMTESVAALGARAKEIARILAGAYPDARCLLSYESPFQLLIATILAAQCTDERVNMVTPALFRRFPDPAAMADADIGELETLVRSTGFFHNKAKSVKGASRALVREFPGGFPRTMDDLVRLPGVGRKTANVVLGNCFSEPAIIMDTHMSRVAQRLALASASVPDAIEREIQPLIPREDWTRFSHSVGFHGRRCCTARSPSCPRCPIANFCPWPGGDLSPFLTKRLPADGLLSEARQTPLGKVEDAGSDSSKG